MAHVVGLLHDIETVDFRAAGSRRDQSREHSDECGLPGSVGAQQGEDLAVLDGK